jgi:hypothetical protein
MSNRKNKVGNLPVGLFREERIRLAKIEGHLRKLQEPRGAIIRFGGRHEDIEPH